MIDVCKYILSLVITNLCTMYWLLLLFLLRYLRMGEAQIRFVEDEVTTKHQLASMDAEIYNRQSMGQQKLANIQENNPYEHYVHDIITKGVVDLGFNVHRSAKNLNVNNESYIVYSPVSIASALYTLLLAANGNTFTELSKILGVSQGLNVANNSGKVHEEFGDLLRKLETSSTDGGLVKFANGLFVQNDFPLRQQYKDVSRIVYQNEVMNLDFKSHPDQSRNYINNWLSEKTFGKIDKILNNNPSSETKVVLVSSLYFKADWAYPFDSSLTKMQTFYPNGILQPSNLKVPILANGANYFYYNDSTLNCEIVGLPYKGHEYTMYFIIPHHSNKEQLKNLESRLTYFEMKRLISSAELKDILVAIPKMKLTTNLELQDILEDNGLRTLFNPRESDLGLLSGSGENRNVLQSVGMKEDQPFVFTRSENDPTNDEDDGTKSNRRRKRQLRVISSNRYENSLDALRHILNKEQNHAIAGLFLNQVLHKVVVDVNEKGTEAAAATGALLAKSNRLIVKANVPFLFFIQHEASGLILFWGSVVTPSPVYT